MSHPLVNKVRENAAIVLMSLADNNPANQTKIVKLGALEPLVNLLRSGSDEAKEHACGALWSLADNNPENQTKIVMNGAVSHLLSLLSEANNMGQGCANEALRTLAKGFTASGKRKVFTRSVFVPL